jgi:hypothetical protein
LRGARETLKGPVLTRYSYLLLGIMKGFFPGAAPVVVGPKMPPGVIAQNSGIAMVVPASKIRDILKSLAVRARTDALLQQEMQKTTRKTH